MAMDSSLARELSSKLWSVVTCPDFVHVPFRVGDREVSRLCDDDEKNEGVGRLGRKLDGMDIEGIALDNFFRASPPTVLARLRLEKPGVPELESFPAPDSGI